MMGVLPRFTADGLVDYLGIVVGITVAAALVKPIASQLQSAISKN